MVFLNFNFFKKKYEFKKINFIHKNNTYLIDVHKIQQIFNGFGKSETKQDAHIAKNLTKLIRFDLDKFHTFG